MLLHLSLYCTATCFSYPLNQGLCLLLTLSPMEDSFEIDARLDEPPKHKLGTLGLFVATRIPPVGRSDPCRRSNQPKARKPLAWPVHLARRAVQTVVGPHGIRCRSSLTVPSRLIDKALHGVCR